MSKLKKIRIIFYSLGSLYLLVYGLQWLVSYTVDGGRIFPLHKLPFFADSSLPFVGLWLVLEIQILLILKKLNK